MANYSRLIDKIRKKSLEEEAIVTSKIRGRPKLIRPVATESDIVTAQERLGFCLPELLAECYLRVGNGGFGPGTSVLGIGPNGSFHSAFDNDLVGTTQAFANSAKHLLPPPENQLALGDWVGTFVVFVDYGCGENGIIDCSNGSMLYDDAGEIQREYTCWEWYFEDWVDGRPPVWQPRQGNHR